MSLYPLPQLTLHGTPEQMGEQHGYALRDQIRAFVPMRMEATREFLLSLGWTSTTALIDVARACMAIHAQWDPQAIAEHRAIAGGAGVDPAELYAAANMTDMRDVLAFSREVRSPGQSLPADAEGCSTVLLPGNWTADGQVLVSQTWDLNPQDLDYVVAIHRLPHDGPETWSVTCSGCLSLVGMNEHGLAVGTTNIKTQGSRPGVGYMGVLHKMLSQRSFAAAAEVCQRAPRAAAHTYWLADAQQIADWETTAWSCQARVAGTQFLVRTNHCLVGAHASAEAEPPSSSSTARLARLIARVGSQHRHDLASLQDLYSDRSDGVDSINRLPEDAQGTATNSVVVCVPERRAMWACRGPADRGQWVQLPFDRAGGGL